MRNRRAWEASGQKKKRQQDIRETFKATKKPKPSVSSSSASSGVSASTATADTDAAPPPQPIPCLGLQWLSAQNPSFFSLEEQGEHFNLVFEYRKAEHLGGVYRETTTEGVLKEVIVLKVKGCTRERTMRSSIPTERVGKDRIEKASLVPRLSFEWTSCNKCYNACAKTFKSSVFGDKKEFLDKVADIIRLCDTGAYTYERDLHIIKQKLQSEQTSAAKMRELFRQQSEKRQLHKKEKNLMKEKGGTSAGPLVGQRTSFGEASNILGEDEDGVPDDEEDLGEEGVLAEVGRPEGDGWAVDEEEHERILRLWNDHLEEMERAEKDERPIPLEQKGEEEKGKERESEQRDEDFEQVVSILVQEDILLDREGGEVSQGDAGALEALWVFQVSLLPLTAQELMGALMEPAISM
uniref:Uncharacterized protein n=1 Tax=Chromera velia CCMP2878 TaxID=1169474 RepID=A0A0G4GHY0_9ALVE|eukprot:Cvel_4735.t1-p1 / transcript=Cvel_4735.t1 / gene=Cvel_4735 / organism=Chromera_velia_CCMP2878 / gene_product=hypothetical protein / transcript_product=hypothetical protein / location=Cvel_scaffold210:95911-109547(+) / protein_length=408 / sequence_SO=supercontig / SO=protein_coding / is_pseudo=false